MPWLRSSAMRRLASVLAGLLVVTLFAAPGADADELKNRERDVREKIRRASSELAHASSTARRARLRLETAQAELADARAKSAEIRQELVAARRLDVQMALELADAEARAAEAEEAAETGQLAVEQQRAEVVDTVVEALQGSDPSLRTFASFLRSDAPADLVRLTQARDAILAKESWEYDELRAAEVLLQVRQQEVESARDAVGMRRAAAAETLDQVRGLRQRAKQGQAVIRDRVLDRRETRRKAVIAAVRDARLLDRLRVEERRIKARIAAAARRAAQRRVGAIRGRMDAGFMRPTAGYISSPFGYRRHPIYGYYGLHDGVDIAAPCGVPVYAPLGGRVMSRYYSDVFGNRVFVGLGFVNGRYLTAVFNHLARSTVRRGSSVRRGQVVGMVGNTGWSTGCHLHFTVLADGKPVDPESFF